MTILYAGRRARVTRRGVLHHRGHEDVHDPQGQGVRSPALLKGKAINSFKLATAPSFEFLINKKTRKLGKLEHIYK